MAVPNTTGVLRANLADMQVGDYIPCYYYAHSTGVPGSFFNLGINQGTEIPYASQAAINNGLFYFIKVDKGLCIADRNVQHTVNWEYIANYMSSKYIDGTALKNMWVKMITPSTIPSATCYGVDISNNEAHMAIAASGSPYVYIYKRNADQTWTKLSNPATLPTSTGFGVKFSPNSTHLAVAHSASPYITIYKRSEDTFTKLSNPSSLPTGTGAGVSWSSDGAYLAIAHSTAPYMTIYKRDGDTFTKLSDPAITPTGASTGAAWSPDNTYLTITHNASPYVTIYKREADTFTKLSNPDVLPPNYTTCSIFSPDGNYLYVGFYGAAPFLYIYKRTGDTFTKQTNPASCGGCAKSLYIAPDGTTLVLGNEGGNANFYSIGSDGLLTSITSPLCASIGYPATGIASYSKGVVFVVNNSPYYTMFQPISENIFIRSLSGGCAYIDINGSRAVTDQSLGAWPRYNEWDRYIVDSDLRGKITAGDDNVWHWSNLYSWTRDTPILGITSSSSRVVRGKDSVRKFAYASSGTASASYGFRPVLEYFEPDATASNFWF